MNNVIKNSAYLLLLSAVLFLSGCSGEQFHVRGTITNAKDSVLYFEHNSLTGFNKMDSVKLDEKVILLFQARRPTIRSSTDCESPTKSSTSVSILPKL